MCCVFMGLLKARVEMDVKAKESSKWAQIFAALWIAVLTILRGLGIISLDIIEIILSGITIAGCFIPVYFSIFLDKLKELKITKG